MSMVNLEAGIASHASAQALTTLARSAFPRVVVEEVELSKGSFLVHREPKDNDGVHRIAWDPAQTTRAKVEAYLNLNVAGPGGYVERSAEAHKALRHVDEVRFNDMRPEVVELWDVVERAVNASWDPQGAIVRMCELITSEADAIQAAK